MQGEFPSEEENLEFEEELINEGPVKNKYETGEVRSIQKAIQDVTRKIEQEKIKLKQLSNEILSLNKRLKKHKHFFDVLIIDKGISISYIKQNKDKNCSDNQKQIRDYYDSTWALNYNNLLIGKNKQKEKYW